MTSQSSCIPDCPEKKTQKDRACPCTHPNNIPCKVNTHRPKESPLCWGTYKDNQKCCQNCDSAQGCAEEIALSIFEGRHGVLIEVS